MARPRKYQTEEEQRQGAAARQADFRTRRVYVDRSALDQLRAAIGAAAAAGDPVAAQVQTGSADALLRNLARWFEMRNSKQTNPR